MKIKIIDTLIIINILNLALISLINFFPEHILRFVFGVPFVLFFPGYALVIAVFASNKRRDILEVVALSIVISAAITAFTGFILNYTTWGIKFETVLYPIAIFTFLVSIVAYIRLVRSPENQLARSQVNKIAVSAEKKKVTSGIKLKFPGWSSSKRSNYFTVVLGISLLAAVSVFGCTLASVNTVEKFTEFYILGPDGQAQNYPSEFALSNCQVQAVRYSSELTDQPDNWGRIVVGIVNHEQRTVSYSVSIEQAGQPVDLLYNGSFVDRMINITLPQGETWEQEIGFAPRDLGQNQKLEILLYKEGKSQPVDSLHLWINVREAGSN